MRLRSPLRLTIVLITLCIVLWMCYNFVIALITGQPFSIWGNPINPQVENIVVAGVDEGGYRTDLILLCQVDRVNDRVSVLQIPRDTYVKNNHRLDRKINSAYYSGFEKMSEEIAQVCGVKPEHYVMVSFSAFRDIVDAVGGVKVEVPMDMKYTDPVQDLVIDLEKGMQKLDGEEAEMFMRFRQGDDGSGYATGDVGRMDTQQTLYTAIKEKLFTPFGILRWPSVFFAVKAHTETDLTSGEMVSLMRDVLAIGKDNIEVYMLPGSGKYMYGASYFVHDEKETQALMQEHFVLDDAIE